jgi:hypothetical protein
MAALAYGYLLLVVLAALIWYGIRLHHIRRMWEVETRELELSGWLKIIVSKVKFAWQCPLCGMPAFTSEGVKAHQDEETSPCAVLQAARAALAEPEPPQDGGMTVTVGTLPREDAWPALGAGDEPEGGGQE